MTRFFGPDIKLDGEHPITISEPDPATKADVDLLRDAVLEIVAFLDPTDESYMATVLGPACTKLLRRKRNDE